MRAFLALLRATPGAIRALVGVGVTAFAVGLCESALLYLIVVSANSLARGHHRVTATGVAHITGSMGTVGWIGAGIVGVFLLLGALNAFLVARLTTRTLADVQVTSLRLFLAAPWSLQSMEPPGRLQDVMSVNAQRVGAGVVALCDIATAALGAAAVLVATSLVHPGVGVAGVVFGLVMAGAVLPTRSRTNRSSEKLRAANRAFNRRVHETVNIARDVTSFGVSAAVLDTLEGASTNARHYGQRNRFVLLMTQVVVRAGALGLVLGGVVVTALKFQSESVQISAAMLLLIRVLVYAQRGTTAHQTVSDSQPYLSEILRLRARYAQSQPASTTAPALGPIHEIAVDDVSYSYGDRPALTGVSFDVQRPAAVAIVGPSGSGKSTLAQLLTGLRSPSSGTITVNGVAVDGERDRALSGAVGFVPQDVVLIEGTVTDNIRFFRAEVTDDDVRRAAERAHILDEIEQLPQGFETRLSADTIQLSGGQRQRIGIARALAGDPSVLILDEPTSALDQVSEARITTTLEELGESIILFVIAHRPSTIHACRRVLVIEAGRLTASGTPAEFASLPTE